MLKEYKIFSIIMFYFSAIKIRKIYANECNIFEITYEMNYITDQRK